MTYFLSLEMPNVCLAELSKEGLLHPEVVMAHWTDAAPFVELGQAELSLRWLPGEGERIQPHPCNHDHLHPCCHLMPAQPTSMPLSEGTGRVSCQSAGMLKCEPVGRGWVNCGKNLPSDVPNMASHSAERERERKSIELLQEQDRTINCCNDSFAKGGTPFYWFSVKKSVSSFNTSCIHVTDISHQENNSSMAEFCLQLLCSSVCSWCLFS